jgi:UPF0176 protein
MDRLEEFQRTLCSRLKLKGRILLSVEGVNGTLSGADQATIQEYISTMKDFDLLRDCGVPEGVVQTTTDTSDDDIKKQRLFQDVDWKESSVEEGAQDEPFPDLKISIVKEIVSTGGLVPVEDLPKRTGKHLTPDEFHRALAGEEDQGKEVVVIDVRNTFEHDIGHFVLPKTGEAAMNPEMVTFSSFDINFCAKNAEQFKNKKVLMYCTGGIRCEKASVMLKKRGVEDVNQLSGGIHRYLEKYGNEGYYKGLNFVFDQRVAMKPSPTEPQNDVVGRCVECEAVFDELCGSRVCAVCRDLVLVCPTCQSALKEYHCRRHSGWKNAYFTFLEVFDEDELCRQKQRLNDIRDTLTPASKCRNTRRTLSRQMEKVTKHMARLEARETTVNRDAPRRCRTCMEPKTVCDGRCWGFWKTKAAAARRGEKRRSEDSAEEEKNPPLPVAVGDKVEPGDHWNTLRLGEKTDSNGIPRKGTVVEVKGWSGDEKDCVAVLWDVLISRGRNQGKVQPQIYRWGVMALDGTRMYDVRNISTT